MSYWRHIEACNRYDPADFLPLRLDGARIGQVPRRRLDGLAEAADLFEFGPEAVSIRRPPGGAAQITAAFDALVRSLSAAHAPVSHRGEAFAVTARPGGPVLFEIDRGAVPLFGIRAYGVHLNGFVRRGNGIELWVGRRAADKAVAPDRLDNIVAGGIGAGYGIRETLTKEADEEASMPAELVARARSAGALAYRMAQPEGSRDDVLFVFDLELPPDFVPVNRDGEIASFERLPVEECLRLVRETDRFKFNVNLVLIDFAIRHGFIDAEAPDYVALSTGLRAGCFADPGEPPYFGR